MFASLTFPIYYEIALSTFTTPQNPHEQYELDRLKYSLLPGDVNSLRQKGFTIDAVSVPVSLPRSPSSTQETVLVSSPQVSPAQPHSSLLGPSLILFRPPLVGRQTELRSRLPFHLSSLTLTRLQAKATIPAPLMESARREGSHRPLDSSALAPPALAPPLPAPSSSEQFQPEPSRLVSPSPPCRPSAALPSLSSLFFSAPCRPCAPPGPPCLRSVCAEIALPSIDWNPCLPEEMWCAWAI